MNICEEIDKTIYELCECVQREAKKDTANMIGLSELVKALATLVSTKATLEAISN